MDLRLLETEPVCYRCYCSRDRVASTLLSLGERELTDILAEGETVTVSCQFCAGCNRLRLTADGKLKPCLHSGQEFSIRGLDDEAMRAQFLRAIREKPARHAPLDLAHQSEAGRSMNEIGG